MKCLLITNSYPDSENPYKGIFIQKLALELGNQGLDVIILCPKICKSSASHQMDQGISVHRFSYPSQNESLGQSGNIPIFTMACYMLSGLSKAISITLKERPEVIHGHWIVPTGLIAAITGKLTGTPVVNTAHGMDIRLATKHVIKPLFNLSCWASQALTVVSPSMNRFRQLKHAPVIPCGINESFFNIKSSSSSNMIISTRSLEPIYNLETLIRAIPLVLNHNPAARFVIVGTGSGEQSLRNLTTALGVDDKVKFTGQLPNDEIPNYMAQAKVYVSTSLADGTSVSLLEALAAGLIPVVSNIEANQPWVTVGHSGFLFEPGNPTDLADKILKAMSTRPSQDQLADKRLALKEQLTWNMVARNFVSIYKTIV